MAFTPIKKPSCIETISDQLLLIGTQFENEIDISNDELCEAFTYIAQLEKRVELLAGFYNARSRNDAQD